MKFYTTYSLLLIKRLQFSFCMYFCFCRLCFVGKRLTKEIILSTVVLLNKRVNMSSNQMDQTESNRKESMAFITNIFERRSSEALVSDQYDFDTSRCRFLTDCKLNKSRKQILYYMQRDLRINDNWAVIYSQLLALKRDVSLHICFFAKQTPTFYPTMRQFAFLVEGKLKSIF